MRRRKHYARAMGGPCFYVEDFTQVVLERLPCSLQSGATVFLQVALVRELVRQNVLMCSQCRETRVLRSQFVVKATIQGCVQAARENVADYAFVAFVRIKV